MPTFWTSSRSSITRTRINILSCKRKEDAEWGTYRGRRIWDPFVCNQQVVHTSWQGVWSNGKGCVTSSPEVRGTSWVAQTFLRVGVASVCVGRCDDEWEKSEFLYLRLFGSSHRIERRESWYKSVASSILRSILNLLFFLLSFLISLCNQSSAAMSKSEQTYIMIKVRTPWIPINVDIQTHIFIVNFSRMVSSVTLLVLSSPALNSVVSSLLPWNSYTLPQSTSRSVSRRCRIIRVSSLSSMLIDEQTTPTLPASPSSLASSSICLLAPLSLWFGKVLMLSKLDVPCSVRLTLSHLPLVSYQSNI